MSGGKNSLSGGKKRLSGGWGRPPLTSVWAEPCYPGYYPCVTIVIIIQIAEGTSERSPRRSRTNGHLPGRTTTVGIMGADEHEKEKSSPKTSSTRLKSLDSFRG